MKGEGRSGIQASVAAAYHQSVRREDLCRNAKRVSCCCFSEYILVNYFGYVMHSPRLDSNLWSMRKIHSSVRAFFVDKKKKVQDIADSSFLFDILFSHVQYTDMTPHLSKEYVALLLVSVYVCLQRVEFVYPLYCWKHKRVSFLEKEMIYR